MRITGAQTQSTERLQALLADAVGKDLDLAGLQALAERITVHYRAQGYAVARAWLPAQEVRDGEVEIAVVEGRLDRLAVNVTGGLPAGEVRARLRHLREGEPLMTRALIALSNLVQNWWFLLLGAIVGVAFLVRRLLKHEHVRRRVHAVLLRAPVFGRVTRGLNTARFTRTLSILTASGVPALEALKISASVIANLPMRAAVEEAAVRDPHGP